MLFKPATQYEPEPTPLTPNRAALVALNQARAEAAAEVSALIGRTNKLARLKESVAALEVELSQNLAADGKLLSDWAMSDTGEPAPQPDSTKRLAIEAKLADAVSQARAADAATASVTSVLERANQRAGELEAKVPAYVANVLLDEAVGLLPGIVEATASLARAKGRYDGLRKFLLERAEAAKDVAHQNGFFHDLEKLDREAADAASIGPMLTFSPGAEWRELAASLGDVAARPTPTLPAAFNLPETTKWTND
jgi:hypothetical protein